MAPNNSMNDSPKTQTYDAAAVEAALRNFEARQNELKARARARGYDPKTGMPLQVDAPQKPQQADAPQKPKAPQQKAPQQPTRTNPAQGGNAPAGGNKPNGASSAAQASAKPKTRETVPSDPKIEKTETLTQEQKAIEDWLKTTKFKKKLLGGVDEADVWKKIGELNSLYEAALSAERARCNAMIEHYKQTCVTAVQKYKQAASSASARRERTGE